VLPDVVEWMEFYAVTSSKNNHNPGCCVLSILSAEWGFIHFPDIDYWGICGISSCDVGVLFWQGT